ncbi:ATP-binding cassette domain-containing protein [Conexibacter woesei]|uniref:ABC transporter related protein n=1 Tax=Conexibacter woesei (strain DSM 14684 / CCUG 47730 / CIP 108061 / JCM 11494 / NBRC 100937 / ID131577) TaxID=469383 RepID=D3EZ15_CONWI|nr:ATP-binding cassette domain-containing protein [Conexibacter woesei]ADB49889.1 ABC transporter related protein [Conexibacter woesei DSM 14684]
MSAPALEIREAYKSFGAVQALNGASLSVEAGEVVALLGDNGAGKSTLIKAMTGVHRLDEGEVLVGGEPVTLRSPADSRRLGIETVYQDLAVFDNLDARANFFVGRERTAPGWLGRLGFLRERAMTREWQEHVDDLQVVIPDPEQPLGVMSGGQRQAIAVARSAAFANRVLILDEPTAALGVRESRQVLDLVKRLPRRGIAVVLISHNLEHVMEVAHRAIVLRRGRNVGEERPTAENHERIVSLIVGAQYG